jgi:hypothetical protein
VVLPVRISADTALRLARFLGTSERFWLNLQSHYDLEMEKDRIGALERSLRLRPSADGGRPPVGIPRAQARASSRRHVPARRPTAEGAILPSANLGAHLGRMARSGS